MKSNSMLPTDLCIAAGLSRPADEAPDCRVTLCHNLRPSPDGAPELVVAGRPAPVAAGQYRPLAVVTLADGRRLLAVSSGKTLARVDLSEWMPGAVEVAVLDSEPLCALATGRKLTVMTEAGATTVMFGEKPDDFTIIRPDTSFPEAAVTAEPVSMATATVAPLKLDKSFAAGTPYITDTQRRATTTALMEAYERISASAAAEGTYFQPVICRYRLYDADGGAIYVSPPVMLSLPCGAQLTGAVEFKSDNREMTLPIDISADTYRLKLTVPPHGLSRDVAASVAKLTLFVTPQFHPVDFCRVASCHAATRAQDNTVMRATFPGTRRDLSPRGIRAAVGRLADAVRHLAVLEHELFTVHDPFASADGAVFYPVCAAITTAERESFAIDKALEMPCTAVLGADNRFAPPHRFSAAAVANSGLTTIWGNLRHHYFKGYSPLSMVVTVKPRRWRAAVSVRLRDSDSSDAETLVNTFSGESCAPGLFNPVLSYPGCQASSMVINLAVEGEDPVTREFPLEPVDGGMAVYIHPTMKPFAISDKAEAFVIPAEEPAIHRLPSAVVLAHTASPLCALRSERLPGCNIMALAATRFNRSEISVKQERFSIFSDRGIHTLTVFADGRRNTIAEIDRRTVASPQSVAVANGAVYALVKTHELVKVMSMHAETVADGIDGTSLAWIALRREFVCGGNGGTATVVCPERGYGRFTRTMSELRGIVHDDSTAEVYALDDTGVVSLVNETSPSSTDIDWKITVDTPDRRYAVAGALTVDMGATRFNGSVTLVRHSTMSAAPASSSMFNIDGRVAAPLTLRNFGHAAPRFSVGIAGSVAPSFCLSLIRLSLQKPSVDTP